MRRDYWTMCAAIARTDYMISGGRKKKMGPAIGEMY